MGIKIVKNSINDRDSAPAASASSRTSRIRTSTASASSRTSRIRTSPGASRTRTSASSSRAGGSRDGSDRRPPPKKQSKAWVVWLVVGGFALLALILICASMGGGNRRGSRSPSSYGIQQARQPHQQQYQPKRYAELGGMTMAEWQAKNNTNNAMLNARMGRRRGATGR